MIIYTTENDKKRTFACLFVTPHGYIIIMIALCTRCFLLFP